VRKGGRAENILLLSQYQIWPVTLHSLKFFMSLFHFLFSSNKVRGKEETTDLRFPIVVYISHDLFLASKVGCSLTPKQMTITQKLEKRHQ